MLIADRLIALRHLMRKQKLDFYFVSHSDPHQNEHPPEAWQRSQYISGFSGSNAEVLVGLDQAYFWTDGRYTEQARLEVPNDLFEIFIYGQTAPSSVQDFISQHLRQARIGADPCTLSLQQTMTLRTAAESQRNALIWLENNLIDAIWQKRPLLLQKKITLFPEQYSGESAALKLKKLREFIESQKQDALILNELASIAWLFNLRGRDISHSPLFLSYALITLTGGILFVSPKALTPKIQDYLQSLKIEVRDYQSFYASISKLCPARVMLDKKSANQGMCTALKSQHIAIQPSPILLWKACKNAIEMQGALQAHHRDALALIRLFAWLERKKIGQTELSVTQKLRDFRNQGKHFQGNSFETIAGYGPHSAIIHYCATPKSNVNVDTDALFLLDSGGQYFEGTTDVTRTIHLGTPTAFEKHCYTLVLKGNLALERAIFPQGTRGEQLDVLARQFLWNEGFNYAHGTGHGVGAFLNVHESPPSISTRSTPAALIPNMIVSNEPGVYLPGQFGIRIENLLCVKPAPIPEFYTFENLTLVPYARKLIDKALLNENEIAQIDAYHTQILEKLSSSLDIEALKWLIEATQPL